MKFNKYIWGLYKNSDIGKKAIDDSKPFIEIPDNESFLVDFEEDWIEEIKQNGFTDFIRDGKVNILKIYHSHFSKKSFQVDAADDIFNQWISDGVNFAGFDVLVKDEDERWWKEIEYISNALYISFPDFFFPYFFLCEFDKFKLICDEYYIALPEIPKKRYQRERTMYYLEICKALYEFRINNGLSPEELIAFFYDFAPNSLAENNNENPLNISPSKVWYVGGGQVDFDFLDNAKNDEIERWQSNIDIRAGDILIMYCVSPRSYIHSVWQAINDGFIDPFFYYYCLTYISNAIKVPPITLQEIKTNPVLSKSPIIRKNFQGVNGYPVAHDEYGEMLRLWAEKGMDITALPKIEVIKYLSDDIVLKDERDVELYLLEPLLSRLKYEQADWIRQMPIRMGRGERYYPDYCFGAISARGEESAKMLIEAKYSIKSTKSLKDAYFQAKSYAMRLQADKFVLASKEGLWIYEKAGSNFDIDKNIHFTWNDIENPDNLHQLMKMIGKKFKA